MRKAIFSFFKSSVVRGMLRGMGGAAVAAIGWKLASDVYDAVKKKVSEGSPETEEKEEKEEDDEYYETARRRS
jgi:hypothetical protein